MKLDDWTQVKTLVKNYVSRMVGGNNSASFMTNPNYILVKNTDLRFSKIISVSINHKIIPTVKAWRKIIEFVYLEINNIDKIMEVYKNIIKGECKTKGFEYMAALDISFQNMSAQVTMQETIKQCIHNQLPYDIHIKLKSGNIVKFNG
jgi:hypothetical protein